jgi:hypothetical protein
MVEASQELRVGDQQDLLAELVEQRCGFGEYACECVLGAGW